jgi:transposase-like protein
MTRKQNTAKQDWKAVMGEDPDFMKVLVREVVQQVLEAEMDDTLGAEKGQRSLDRSFQISGCPKRKAFSCAAKQKPISIVLDSSQLNTKRLNQSITATR